MLIVLASEQSFQFMFDMVFSKHESTLLHHFILHEFLFESLPFFIGHINFVVLAHDVVLLSWQYLPERYSGYESSRVPTDSTVGTFFLKYIDISVDF